MQVLTWEQLFGPITGVRNKSRSLKNAKWQSLEEDTWFDGTEYAKGSKFRIFEGEDFGYVQFSGDSKTPEGNTPERFLHKY